MLSHRARTPAKALALALCLAPGAAAQAAPPFSFAGPSFFAVQTSDADEAAGWYRRVFGLEEVNRIDDSDGRYEIRILSARGLSVEVIRSNRAMTAEAIPLGLFKAGLYVDDLDAAHDWLDARGVDVDAATFTDEALQARSFVLRDPDGNRIQLFERCAGPCGA